MNMFKRKQERSEWMEGLINAERIVRSHGQVPYHLIIKDYKRRLIS